MTADVRGRPPAGALILLAVFGVLFAGILAELSLRAFGFRFVTFPAVQFGWPEPREIIDVYKPDRELFWVTRDYAGVLAEARRTRPAVVFMGDSCTEFGTWPELTLQLMAARDPSLGRGVKLAVGGWSSEQGVRQLRRDVVPLQPRLVVIFYGWNDHWLAFGKPDAEVHASAVSFWLTEHVRLVQLLVKSRLAVGAASARTSYRVPLERYRMNVAAMARLAQRAGITAVFVTAPSSHQRGREPAYLARRHLARLDELVPLHTSYVVATREAAEAAGAQVCDAAAMFPSLPLPVEQYFTHDGIHFSELGSRALAEMLANCLRRVTSSGGAYIRLNLSVKPDEQDMNGSRHGIIHAMSTTTTTTMDAAGRLVIPKAVRQEAALEPGVVLDVRWRDGVIELEPQAAAVTLRRRGWLLVASPDRKTPALRAAAVERTRRAVRRR